MFELQSALQSSKSLSSAFSTMANKTEDEVPTESNELLQTVKSDLKSGRRKLGWIIGVILVLGLLIAGIVFAITHFNTNQAASGNITNDQYDDYYFDEYPDVDEHLAGSSSKIAKIQNVRLNLYVLRSVST